MRVERAGAGNRRWGVRGEEGQTGVLGGGRSCTYMTLAGTGLIRTIPITTRITLFSNTDTVNLFRFF